MTSKEEANKQWEALEKAGIAVDYIRIKDGVISPEWTLEELDWVPRAETKLRFLNKNGYDMQREHAAEVFLDKKELILEGTDVGGWSSNYRFEGIQGEWNSVMFDHLIDIHEYPNVKKAFLYISHDYGYHTDCDVCESEKEFLEQGVQNYLNYVVRISCQFLKDLDEWIGTLSEDDFTILTEGFGYDKRIEFKNNSPKFLYTSHGDKLLDVIDDYFFPKGVDKD